MSLDRFQIFCPNKHSDVQLGQHTDRTFQVQIQVKMTMMRMKLVMRIIMMRMMMVMVRAEHTKPTFTKYKYECNVCQTYTKTR